jgi:hypothetical protein
MEMVRPKEGGPAVNAAEDDVMTEEEYREMDARLGAKQAATEWAKRWLRRERISNRGIRGVTVTYDWPVKTLHIDISEC